MTATPTIYPPTRQERREAKREGEIIRAHVCGEECRDLCVYGEWK